ncbi:ribosome-associated protein [Aquisalimonas asiatica]|uniref:Ribosomal silencing factor RsfS n=2 Tax=Aquisalimonas asiatica TaxID=406100 RepID=A0A1H8S9W3_9GAMM|nr:ribosome silencing factor [Aquisalimonas asiatica]SEO75422.1 ribosome-associated protein [Aquisalimonas asiatica]
MDHVETLDWAALRDVVLASLEDMKAVDPVVLDVRGKTGITDIMVVASGNSGRHVKAIADRVVEDAREQGVRPLGVEGEDSAEWVLVDLGDVVVHVMGANTRELYRLERIWGIDDADSDASSADSSRA